MFSRFMLVNRLWPSESLVLLRRWPLHDCRRAWRAGCPWLFVVPVLGGEDVVDEHDDDDADDADDVDDVVGGCGGGGGCICGNGCGGGAAAGSDITCCGRGVWGMDWTSAA